MGFALIVSFQNPIPLGLSEHGSRQACSSQPATTAAQPRFQQVLKINFHNSRGLVADDEMAHDSFDYNMHLSPLLVFLDLRNPSETVLSFTTATDTKCYVPSQNPLSWAEGVMETRNFGILSG